MSKFLLILVFFLSSASVIPGQNKPSNFEVEWSEEYKGDKHAVITKLIEVNDGGYLAVLTEDKAFSFKKHYVLKRYDEHMQPVKEKELELDDGDKERVFFSVEKIGGRIYVFTKTVNDEDVETIHAHELDLSSLQPGEPIRVAGQIPAAAWLKFELAEDASHLFIINSLPEKSNEAFRFQLFNASFDKIESRNLELPYSKDLIPSHLIRATIEGDLHILTKVLKEKGDEVIDGRPNFHYELFSFYSGTNEPSQNSIAPEGKFVTDVKLELDKASGALWAFSFYTGNEEMDATDGLIVAKLDHDTQSWEFKKEHPFGMDFIVEGERKRVKRKAKKKKESGEDLDMKLSELRDILFEEDGSVLVAAEQEKEKWVGHGSSSDRVTEFQDAVLIKLDRNGQRVWQEKIPKSHVGKEHLNGSFFSYSIVPYSGNYYIIFNGNKKNIGNEKGDRYRTWTSNNKSVGFLSKVNSTGDSERHVISSAKEDDVHLLVEEVMVIGDGRILVPGKDKRRKRFGIIQL